MGGIVFILMLLVVFIGIPVMTGLLVYFIPQNHGYPKTAQWLTGIYLVLIGYFVVSAIFEDEHFTKNDAKELLAGQDITLANDFTINKNASTSSIGDYYHTFILTISPYDKGQIINSIKSAHGFKRIKEGTQMLELRFNPSIDSYKGTKVTQNYETTDAFVKELYEPNGTGYAPTYIRITIEKMKNTLMFEDIDD